MMYEYRLPKEELTMVVLEHFGILQGLNPGAEVRGWLDGDSFVVRVTKASTGLREISKARVSSANVEFNVG